MKKGRKLEYLEKIPDNELQKMPHTEAWKLWAPIKTPTHTLWLVAGAWQELFVGCWTSQQHASLSQGQICSDNFMCYDTEIEVVDQTFHLTQSQYTDTGPTSPNADLITPGRLATGVPIFKSLVWLDPEKILAQAGFEPRVFRSRGGCLATRPTRWCLAGKLKC